MRCLMSDVRCLMYGVQKHRKFFRDGKKSMYGLEKRLKKIIIIMITKKVISEKTLSYLQHHTTLNQIVHWAEETLMFDNFEDDDTHTIRNILARIGSADVKNFGLTWENCEEIMHSLDFSLQVLVKAAS